MLNGRAFCSMFCSCLSLLETMLESLFPPCLRNLIAECCPFTHMLHTCCLCKQFPIVSTLKFVCLWQLLLLLFIICLIMPQTSQAQISQHLFILYNDVYMYRTLILMLMNSVLQFVPSYSVIKKTILYTKTESHRMPLSRSRYTFSDVKQKIHETMKQVVRNRKR